MSVNLLRRLQKNWDCGGGGGLALSEAFRWMTKDCAELSGNAGCRNVLLGLLSNHQDPPTVEEVLMDHFKSASSFKNGGFGSRRQDGSFGTLFWVPGFIRLRQQCWHHQQGRLRHVGSLFEKSNADGQKGFVFFGNPPDACGCQTVPAPAADFFTMQIRQHVRKRHSDFVMDHIKEKHGPKTLRSVFPQPLPPADAVVAQAANQGNNSADPGKHSDLKPGLHRNGNGPVGPFDFTTPALSIQDAPA
jgi:hypothetical protein